MGTLCYISLVVAVVVCHTVLAVEDEEHVPIKVEVNQHISISRRRRSIDDVEDAGEEYFDFPEHLRFSFDLDDKLIDLNLTRSMYVTTDMTFIISGRKTKHDYSDRMAVYQSVQQLAAVLVECHARYCTLQGSVEIDEQPYSIEPEHLSSNNKAHILRKREALDLEKFKQTIYAQQRDDSGSTAVSHPRAKRDGNNIATFDPECDVFELKLLVDNTIWNFFLDKNNGDMELTIEEIWKYYTAVMAEVNLRYSCLIEHITKYCKGLECEINCLQVILCNLEISETTSWTDYGGMRFDYTFQDGIRSTFFDGWKGLQRCGDLHTADPNSNEYNLFICLTKWNMAVREGNTYYDWYRTYTWVPSICDSNKRYPSIVSESNGDGLDRQLAHAILHSIGASGTSCERKWLMKEDMNIVSSEPAGWGLNWFMSRCAIEEICDKIASLNSGNRNCLRDHHFSQSKWDTFVDSPLPGELFSADDQCKHKWGIDSTQCDPEGEGNMFPDYMCSRFIYCTNEDGCVCNVRVTSGTPCGYAKYCYKGQCIPIPDQDNGEECECHSQCTTPNAHCDEHNGTCVCDDGYYDDNYEDIGGNCTEKSPNGGECYITQQCLDSQAICVNDTCVCAPGYYNNNGVCELEVCLGEPCCSTEQCFGDNVKCCDELDICVCVFGYFVNDIGQCVLYNGTLCDPCIKNPDSCTQQDTVCGADGFCECANDTVEFDGTCYGTHYGDDCTTDLDTCVDHDTECSASVSGTCVCVSGFTFQNDQCVGSDLCEACQPDMDTCDNGLECSESGYCICANGTVQVANQCYGTHYGDNCTTDLDTCVDHDTECSASVSGTCVCVSGFTFQNDQCVGSDLCEACQPDMDTCGSGLECSESGYCICSNDTVQVANECYGTHYGDNCTTDLDTCVDHDTECSASVSGTCVCVSGFTFQNDQCVGSDLCEACQPDMDTCGSGLECSESGYCICSNDTVQVANECYGTHYGDNCTTDLDTCVDHDTECSASVSGTCVCVSGFTFQNDQCVGSDLCEACQPDMDTCGSGLECSESGYCICSNDTVQVANECYGTHYGDNCTTDLDTCVDHDTECSASVSGTCVCVSGFTFQNDQCVGSDLCEACQPDMDTCGSGLECSESGYCICSNDTVQVANECYGTHYGDNCTTDLDTCVDHDTECSASVSGTCVCVSGFTFQNDQCVGSDLCEACQPDMDTCGSGLECSESGYCICSNDTVQVANECYGTHYGDNCTTDLDTCVDHDTECSASVSGTCVCVSGFTFQNDQCVGSDLCEACQPDMDTCGSGLECSESGYCICSNDTVQVANECYGTHYGDNCTTDLDTCVDHDTECSASVSGTCVCVSGFTFQNDQCVGSDLCEACQPDMDTCGSGLECSESGYCICSNDTVQVANECYGTHYGDNCTTDLDTCVDHDTECSASVSGTCVCVSGFTFQNDQCVGSDLCEACQPDMDTCGSGLECSESGYCICSNDTVQVANECYGTHYGDNCTTDLDTCVDHDTECSASVSGTCVCVSGFTFQNDQCVGSDLCEACQPDMDSCGSGLECSESGYCICSNDTVQVANECYGTHYGDNCTTDLDTCVDHDTECSASVSGTCVCVSGFTFQNDQCVGSDLCEACQPDMDTCGSGLECSESGYCICSNDTVQVANECYGTHYGDNCTTDLDTCVDHDTECSASVSGTCVCVSGFTFQNDQCVGSDLCEACQPYMDTCGSGLECSESGYCICSNDTVQVANECYGTHYGDNCTTDLDTCVDHDTECSASVSGTCVCVSGFTFQNDQCVGSELCDPCQPYNDTCDDGLECSNLGYCVCANGSVQVGTQCFVGNANNTDNSKTQCEDGWMAYNGWCYLFGPQSSESTYAVSKIYCEDLNSNLVSVRSTGENEFLKAQLAELKATEFWMGMTDEVVEGTWRWIDLDDEIVFEDWYTNQPNNPGTFKCAIFKHGFDYRWDDVMCSSTSIPVCKKTCI